MLPEEIKKFVEVFSKIPSIGPRQATRLAFLLTTKQIGSVDVIINALNGLSNVKICTKCFFIHTNNGNLCNICLDKNRVRDIFMVVEKETDLITVEQTGKYKGQYLVIGQLIKSGFLESWQKLRLNTLKKYTEDNLPERKAKEIILALNPNAYGDLTASLIKKELNDYANKISRIGRGIPTGGEIEFADPETLEHSILRRE